MLSKKFRKYSAKPELIEYIKASVDINVKENKPINITFLGGLYKLWRLDEAPEADWAELFAMMYYASWLKPICEIYEPGAWFDAFGDDYIVPIIDNVSPEEVDTYRNSYQNVMNFLHAYRPSNLKMTITSVGEKFESLTDFETKLQEDVQKYAADLPGGLPSLNEEKAATIELNARPSAEQKKDPKWREKIALVHDAYITLTKARTGYNTKPEKIRAFTVPLPSGMTISVGATKDSIAKYWVGVGALKPKDDTYRQLILSPSQLEKATFKWEKVNIPGLKGKNFSKIRVLS